MSLNKAFLLGNLGADPELRYTQSQNPVCTMRIATTDRRKDASGEWVEQTEWHTVVAWGKTAENCSQYLKKGRQIFVEGKIQTRKWQDKDGNNRYTTEVVATTVQFVGGKGEGAGSGAGRGQSAPDAGFGGGDMPSAAAIDAASSSSAVAFDDDDIPF